MANLVDPKLIQFMHFLFDNGISIDDTTGQYRVKLARGTVGNLDTTRTYGTWDEAAYAIVSAAGVGQLRAVA